MIRLNKRYQFKSAFYDKKTGYIIPSLFIISLKLFYTNIILAIDYYTTTKKTLQSKWDIFRKVLINERHRL